MVICGRLYGARISLRRIAVSQEKSLSISRAEIDNFLQILDEFLIRSKLTLYDHYNSKYVVSEDTIILVC